MAFTSDYYKSLFNSLLEGKLSPDETELLVEWLNSEKQDPLVAELIVNQIGKDVPAEAISPELRAALDAKLPLILEQGNNNVKGQLRFLPAKWLRYAAIVIIFLGIGTYLIITNKNSSAPSPSEPVIAATGMDIAPGKNGAVLTLDNGNTLVLDSMGNGVVATQNGSKVILKNGQLVYDANGEGNTAIAFNTMTTQRGRQFQLVLPDGTKAWLNAASSIRYPTVFIGKERKVEVTGEVYFEVTKNPKMPFRVKMNNETEIEVLGTHFNVNSYKDEGSTATTLLEGSVQIFNKGQKALLKPGQQAQVTDQASIKVLNNVDMEKVMAWKNGVFNFQDASLKEVMHQLERWYDIDVVYEKGIPALEFMGSMGRDLSLNEVLRGLQVSDVHFRIESGRRVVVMP